MPITTISQTFHVPARTGKGFRLRKGDLVCITDLEGQQPVDFWALNTADIYEHLSCEHTKPSIKKLFPHEGDAAYTTHRRPIVTLVEDHASCQDNFRKALRELGIALPYTPQPWNLFTNFFINADGSFSVKAPATR